MRESYHTSFLIIYKLNLKNSLNQLKSLIDRKYMRLSPLSECFFAHREIFNQRIDGKKFTFCRRKRKRLIACNYNLELLILLRRCHLCKFSKSKKRTKK